MACLMRRRIQLDRLRSSCCAAFCTAFSKAGEILISRRALLAVGFLLMAPPGEHAGPKHRAEFGGTVVLQDRVGLIESWNQSIKRHSVVVAVQPLHSDQRLNSHASHTLTTGQAARVVALVQRPFVQRSPASRLGRVTFAGCSPVSIRGSQIARWRIALSQPFAGNLGQPRATVSLSSALHPSEIFGQPSHSFNVLHLSVRVKRIPGGICG